ncbi:uncharacterized protein LOC124896243 [Capsicum annuum]|uniref:uncharacterized protein LOC124896243 n=1 Tax=Capsicum annuum TaxID=4072 RepID=UPI001FB052CA|nr:uncharacterized protein LOC124896243 [Capsicum annuum]
MANQFFLNGEILYRRTPDLGFLRCIDATEATRLLEKIHAGTYRPYMNGFMLAKKVLRAGYFWMTMERDSIQLVQKCYQCQVHGDFIRVSLNELNVMGSPWPFAAWGMDVIGPIEPSAFNGHRFILVAIDYFTKWVEASTHKVVIKNVVVDFARNNLVCRFRILESIITANGSNLNRELMREICERTSTGATPYMLVYGSKAMIPAEVEIPLLKVIQEVGLDDAEWICSRIEQLMLIEEKRLDAVCHGQLYQNRMIKAFNKKFKPRRFTLGQLVLKKIFPHQDEAKGKFAPNWQGPYIVHRVLSGGAVILTKMDGIISMKPINSDAIKKYYI